MVIVVGLVKGTTLTVTINIIMCVTMSVDTGVSALDIIIDRSSNLRVLVQYGYVHTHTYIYIYIYIYISVP
jgi:hypothetical protein